MVSHELKTPITSIKGYVQLLLSLISPNREINLSEIPLQPSLVRIDKQIIRLTKLISELLDVGRLVESKLVLKVETFNIKNLVIETVEDVLHTTSTHTINITHNIDAEINGDRDRIQQVLINFINNAIKYSPVNRVVELFVNKAENNHVAVSVKDFGIGINAADNEKIFERFYRVEGKNEETFSGFGIGLFIAREIIEKHQGKITVESLVGQGSVFTFILPLAT